jgi:hypothetical protein
MQKMHKKILAICYFSIIVNQNFKKMKNNLKQSFIGLLLCIVMIACNKENRFNTLNKHHLTEPLKLLNENEKAVVSKFEHASLVLQGLFSAKPEIRKEFNGFIAAKLAKSGTDEELSFQEIFQAKEVSLTGVRPDFLIRFRDAFSEIFIKGNYPKSHLFSHVKFNSIEDVAAYYDIPTQQINYSNSNVQLSSSENPNWNNSGIAYEIYFPYSDNWHVNTLVNYAISHHPLSNVEWNYGMFFDPLGNPLYEVTINDDYAFSTPTYIITYDDGLKLEDFSNGNMPIEAANYKIDLTNNDYTPIIIESPVIPNPSTCTKELRVKDGRWTLLRNGYGIFEGKIEFAVAVTRQLTEVSVPSQNIQSNPIIHFNRGAHAWGYKKLRRRKIRDMERDLNDYISFGLKVSPWCSGQADKMIFLYEYDKPWVLSQNAKEISNVLTAGAGLIGDSTTRAIVSSLTSAGLAPLVKNLLEGTAQSKIEHFSIIGSNAVWANHRIPTNGSNPNLLNGFRPYGKNSVMATMVID